MSPRPLVLSLLFLLLRCSGDGTGSAPARFTCPRPDEAPLPDEAGGTRCLRVGARENVSAATWPDVTGLPTPVLYVRPDAPAGGDGSLARPLRDVADALSRAAGTIALARGEHAVNAPVTIADARVLVGADPGGVTLRLAPGAGLRASAALRLQGVALRARTTGADARDLPLSASRGATLTLDDVVVEGGWDGVTVQDATLVARRLTVRRAARRAVSITGDALGVLRSLLVREGNGPGVVVDRARVRIAEALVASQGAQGVTLLGDGNATGGATDCAADDPRTAPGPLDCVQDLAVIDGRIVGLWLRGRRRVEGRRLLVARTRTVAGDPGADGLYVGESADVTLDPGINTESMQGRGSIFADNARVGVVVDGGGPAASPRSRLTLQGAWIDANASGGAFVQNSAVVPRVMFCRFVGNSGVGLAAVPSASIMSIGCNGFLSTRPATLDAVTLGGAPVRLSVADGLSVARATDVLVAQNTFTANDRYGALFVGASGRVEANRGTGSRYGLGVYDSAMLTVAPSNQVTGREPPPPTLPGVVSQ